MKPKKGSPSKLKTLSLEALRDTWFTHENQSPYMDYIQKFPKHYKKKILKDYKADVARRERQIDRNEQIEKFHNSSYLKIPGDPARAQLLSFDEARARRAPPEDALPARIRRALQMADGDGVKKRKGRGSKKLLAASKKGVRRIAK